MCVRERESERVCLRERKKSDMRRERERHNVLLCIFRLAVSSANALASLMLSEGLPFDSATTVRPDDR